MSKTTWTLEELKQMPIPDDFNHLWNVLVKNENNTLTEDILYLQIKAIQNIRPAEVYDIVLSIKSVIKYFNICYKYSMSDKNYHLAVCFLKYGLDGISVRYKEICSRCSKKQYIAVDEEYEPLQGECKEYGLNHDSRIKELAGYILIICDNCGLCKKISFDTEPDSIDSFGPCFTIKQHHVSRLIRELYCPYEPFF